MFWIQIIEKNDIICPKCKRNLANKKMLTKNGCKGCDIEYFHEQRKKSRKRKCCKGLYKPKTS
jgi:hypothetical protein